jgi:hypothetical protein
LCVSRGRVQHFESTSACHIKVGRGRRVCLVRGLTHTGAPIVLVFLSARMSPPRVLIAPSSLQEGCLLTTRSRRRPPCVSRPTGAPTSSPTRWRWTGRCPRSRRTPIGRRRTSSRRNRASCRPTPLTNPISPIRPTLSTPCTWASTRSRESSR